MQSSSRRNILPLREVLSYENNMEEMMKDIKLTPTPLSWLAHKDDNIPRMRYFFLALPFVACWFALWGSFLLKSEPVNLLPPPRPNPLPDTYIVPLDHEFPIPRNRKDDFKPQFQRILPVPPEIAPMIPSDEENAEPLPVGEEISTYETELIETLPPSVPETENPVIIVHGQKPYPVFRVRPKYPEVAQRLHLEGMVVIECIIEKDGTPSSCKILRADSPLFEQPALRAIKAWIFAPGQIDGRIVRSYFTATFRFRLE